MLFEFEVGLVWRNIFDILAVSHLNTNVNVNVSVNINTHKCK